MGARHIRGLIVVAEVSEEVFSAIVAGEGVAFEVEEEVSRRLGRESGEPLAVNYW